MPLIAEYELRTPILRAASNAIRKIRLEEIYGTATDAPKLLFWAFGDAIDSFESALEGDPSVRAFRPLESAADRHLYSVTLSERAASRLTYPLAAEHDISILEIVVTDETVVRARVPSRETLLAYREDCLEKDVDVRLRRIYRQEESPGEEYGVTEPQRDALCTALEAGYFEVPRETTLSTLAADLDISDQALSARLRRGQANLLEHTLADDS